MIRTIRNRLTDLLLAALRDPGSRDATLWLSVYCRLRARRRGAAVTVTDLQGEWRRRYPARIAGRQAFVHSTAELEGLLQVRHGEAEALAGRASPGAMDPARLRVEPYPDLLPYLSSACERIEVYARVILQAEAQQVTLDHLPALRRAVAEAALCFNAGLFFEAHEHLEHHWVVLPPSPIKRFLQGVVQVSVGFHHAMRGSYEGAVNQLGKGLEKLAAPPTDTLGVDVPRLQREVREIRTQIMARGRAEMRKADPNELPRIHVTLSS